MASFKFPWPGKRDDARPSGHGGYRSAASQTESVEEMRRRARNRLIGAAVLVVLGVIGFPLLFDTQPRPIPVDVPITIPDRDQVAPLVLSENQTATAPASATTPVAAAPTSPEPATTAAPSARAKPTSAASPATSTPAPKPTPKPETARAAAKPDVKPDTKTDLKADPKSAPQPDTRPEPPRPPVNDAARARALLEGRPLPPAASSPPAPTAKPAPATTADTAPPGRFIVQVGAFADPDKANEIRRKLESAGLKTYTQAVDTASGLRIRVRVGPFSQRVDAEKAAARVVQLGLSGSVLAL